MVCGKKHSKHITTPNRMVNVVYIVSEYEMTVIYYLKGPSSIGVDVNFLNFENVYGIPEHADAFALRSTQYVCFLHLKSC